MSKPVLFTSQRTLERAENIKALYEAYDGPKQFVRLGVDRRHPEIVSGKYDLMVTDEYPEQTPGKVILLWHAIAGGKTIGLDQPGPYVQRKNMKMINYSVTSGTGVVALTAKNSDLREDQVLPLGMPRTDTYGYRRKGDGHTFLANKRAYLYAPTFRTLRETGFPEIDWEWLDGQLKDYEVMAVKAHMCGQSILGGKKYQHIREVSGWATSAEYLYDCDVVITDYSSIIFDGYLLGKPSVLFEKRKGYTESRGMYFEYPGGYSSRYCTNEEDLLKIMREAKGLNDPEWEVAMKVADKCDGHACERVCALIRSMI